MLRKSRYVCAEQLESPKQLTVARVNPLGPKRFSGRVRHSHSRPHPRCICGEIAAQPGLPALAQMRQGGLAEYYAIVSLVAQLGVTNMKCNSRPFLSALVLTFVMWALALPQAAFPADIVAATSGAADPGSAYDSQRQVLVSGACLENKNHQTGSEKASGDFQLLNSETTIADQLGFSAGAKARYGVISATVDARFFRESKSNAFSVSAVWISEYQLLSYKLDSNAPLTPDATKAQQDPVRWKQLCGDEYVDEIVRGARLFFSIRIDFASEEVRQKFSSNFSIAGPLASAEMSMQQATAQFSRNAKVTISALQVGGDVTKFTGLFPQTVDGRASFVSCTLGEFTKCQEVIQAALKYASDLKDGFPAQLADKSHPNYLVYHTAPYSAHGVFAPSSPELAELVAKDRSEISKEFESELKTSYLIDSLLAVNDTTKSMERIALEKQKITKNLNALAQVGNICYNEFDKCIDTYNSLVLEKIDKNVLELPPPPIASFRYMDELDDIYDRGKSTLIMSGDDPRFHSWVDSNLNKDGVIYLGYASHVSFLNKQATELSSFSDSLPIGKLSEDPAVNCEGLPCRTFSYYKDQIRLLAHPNGSVILFIEGTELRTAALYFQGRELKKITLNTDARRGDHRYTENTAVLVIETDRRNNDWWDLNIDKETIEISKEKKSGDGLFYVAVTDVFGRERRFDLSYVAWVAAMRPIVAGQADPKVLQIFTHKRHKWWSLNYSPGTPLSNDGDWSTDAWARTLFGTIVGDPPDMAGWQ